MTAPSAYRTIRPIPTYGASLNQRLGAFRDEVGPSGRDIGPTTNAEYAGGAAAPTPEPLNTSGDIVTAVGGVPGPL